MADSDFVSEHKKLINTLSHPTKRKLLEEKIAQTKEVKEFKRKKNEKK